MKLISKIAIVSLAACSIFSLTGCTALESMGKDFESGTSGLDRTVTLYDYEGDKIASWRDDSMRVESESSQGVSFIANGKRVQIEGGITVVEEN